MQQDDKQASTTELKAMQVQLNDIIDGNLFFKCYQAPTSLDVMKLNVACPFYLMMIRTNSLGWSSSLPPKVEQVGKWNILHDALLFGMALARCVRNAAGYHRPAFEQRPYTRPESLKEAIHIYITALTQALVAEGSEKTWTMERELFFLATGMRAYFDGFIINRPEFLAGCTTPPFQILVMGSCGIPCIATAPLPEDQTAAAIASDLKTRFRESLLRFISRSAARPAIAGDVVFEVQRKPEQATNGLTFCEKVIVDHLKHLVNCCQRECVTRLSVMSSMQPVPDTISAPKRSRSEQTAIDEKVTPESGPKRPKRVSSVDYGLSYDEFKRSSKEFVAASGRLLKTSDLLKGHIRHDMNENIDGVFFMARSDQKSAPYDDLLGCNPDRFESDAFDHIAGFDRSQSRTNIVIAPKPGSDDKLGWLKERLPEGVSLHDIIIRMPRFNSDAHESYAGVVQVIQQSYMGSISGIGPKFYGCIIYSNQKVHTDVATHDMDRETSACMFIMQRIHGVPLFEVKPYNVTVRCNRLSALFSRLAFFNCYNFDSKELNFMVHKTAESDESSGKSTGGSVYKRVYLVDWDSSWAGFLLDQPSGSTFATNFHYYVLNSTLFLRGKLFGTSVFTQRLKSLEQFYLQNKSKAANMGTAIMARPWAGHGNLLNQTHFLCKSSPEMEAAHYAQAFLFSVCVKNFRSSILDGYKKDPKSDSLTSTVRMFMEQGSDFVRFFVTKRNNKTMGELISQINSMFFNTTDNARAYDTLPKTCTEAELLQAIDTRNLDELKSCIGYTYEGCRARSWVE